MVIPRGECAILPNVVHPRPACSYRSSHEESADVLRRSLPVYVALSRTVLPQAVDALVVALAARRVLGSATTSCLQCCCGSSGAVTELAAMEALGRALFWDAPVGAEARGRSPLCWPLARSGRVDRWGHGG